MLKVLVSITLYLSASRTFNTRVPANHEPNKPIIAPVSVCGKGDYTNGDIFYIDRDLSKCYQIALDYNASAIIIDEHLWGNYVFQHDEVMARVDGVTGSYLTSPILIHAEIIADPTPSIFVDLMINILYLVIIVNVAIAIKMFIRFISNYTNVTLKREHIPISKYNSEESDTCSICLEDFKKGDKIRTTKCNHIYHEICLDGWIRDERADLKCPNCNGLLFI